MNILLISNKGIFPRDGGNLAVLNLAEGYTRLGNKVELLTMVTHKHENPPKEIEEFRKLNIEIRGVEINTKISVSKLLFNLLFSNKPYNLERFISQKFSEQIIDLVKNRTFDFVQFEGLYTLPYLHLVRRYHKSKIIYRSHNIEHIIWQENARNSKSLIKKFYFNLLAKRLLYFEKQMINTYDVLLPITQIDATYYQDLNNNKPCLVTPFGIKSEFYNPINKNNTKLDNKSSILFLGSLDWIPNQDGLIWFIDKCLPIIADQISDIKLYVAGRNAPTWLIEKLKKKTVDFVGNVENAYDFFNQEGVFIVPLFSGSGMRVKIIEAMALGKAIVSTPKGIEGIQYSDNEILIAYTPEKFADHIIRLLENTELQNSLSKFAQERIKKEYTIDSIASTVINFINQN
jgi:polysaccharide biosynthesis protein PslH